MNCIVFQDRDQVEWCINVPVIAELYAHYMVSISDHHPVDNYNLYRQHYHTAISEPCQAVDIVIGNVPWSSIAQHLHLHNPLYQEELKRAWIYSNKHIERSQT